MTRNYNYFYHGDFFLKLFQPVFFQSKQTQIQSSTFNLVS